MKKPNSTPSHPHLILSLILGMITTGLSHTQAQNDVIKSQETNEISKANVLDAINAFNIAETSEDSEVQEQFPWRSFRKLIQSLKTPEHAGWLIESMETWIDGEDQETTSMISSKIGELSGPEQLTSLLEKINSPIGDHNKTWAIECIARSKNDTSYEMLKEIITSAGQYTEIEESLGVTPAEAAARALTNSNHIGNINFLLETLQKASTDNTNAGLMQRLAITRAIRDRLLSFDADK